MLWKALCLKPEMMPLSPPVLAERREKGVVAPPTAMGINPASATSRPLSEAFPRQPAKTKPLTRWLLRLTSRHGDDLWLRESLPFTIWVFLDCTELDRFIEQLIDENSLVRNIAIRVALCVHNLLQYFSLDMFIEIKSHQIFCRNYMSINAIFISKCLEIRLLKFYDV